MGSENGLVHVCKDYKVRIPSISILNLDPDNVFNAADHVLVFFKTGLHPDSRIRIRIAENICFLTPRNFHIIVRGCSPIDDGINHNVNLLYSNNVLII